MLFKRTDRDKSLATGAVFERQREYNLKEVATVVWVGNDPFGIPHVRFSLIVPGFDDAPDIRVLSASVFRERYRPTAAATAA